MPVNLPLAALFGRLRLVFDTAAPGAVRCAPNRPGQSFHFRHHHAHGSEPTPTRVQFWLAEARAPDRLAELARRFPAEARAQTTTRPLLAHAIAGDLAALRPALDAEVRAEQDKDRAYWR